MLKYKVIVHRLLTADVRTKQNPLGLLQSDLETLLQAGKRNRKENVPRPQNSWILYRKVMLKDRKTTGCQLSDDSADSKTAIEQCSKPLG